MRVTKHQLYSLIRAPRVEYAKIRDIFNHPAHPLHDAWCNIEEAGLSILLDFARQHYGEHRAFEYDKADEAKVFADWCAHNLEA